MNNNTWEYLLGKMLNIQYGLLRVKNKIDRRTFQIKMIGSIFPFSIHFISSPNDYSEKLINQKASLIQKSGSGYLYITGYVTSVKQSDNCLFFMNVLKACWFERIENAAGSWLEEVCMYEKLEKVSAA